MNNFLYIAVFSGIIAMAYAFGSQVGSIVKIKGPKE